MSLRRCLQNKPMLREAEAMLGQGDRGGGGTEARATEVNAGPAWLLPHPEGVNKALVYFEDSAQGAGPEMGVKSVGKGVYPISNQMDPKPGSASGAVLWVERIRCSEKAMEP